MRKPENGCLENRWEQMSKRQVLKGKAFVQKITIDVTESCSSKNSFSRWRFTWVLKASSVKSLIFSSKQERNSSIFLSTNSELKEKQKIKLGRGKKTLPKTILRGKVAAPKWWGRLGRFGTGSLSSSPEKLSHLRTPSGQLFLYQGLKPVLSFLAVH